MVSEKQRKGKAHMLMLVNLMVRIYGRFAAKGHKPAPAKKSCRVNEQGDIFFPRSSRDT
jgi:hypothetical protein